MLENLRFFLQLGTMRNRIVLDDDEDAEKSIPKFLLSKDPT